jgi:osmotically-inducible protein OsmY
MNMRIVSVLLLALLGGSLQGSFPVIAAGVGTGVLMANDRRSNGAYVEDEAIENKAIDYIGKNHHGKVHVNVTSYNRNLLLTGETLTAEQKSEIERFARSIQNVRTITNELVVSGLSSLTSRSSDSMITSEVKLRFMRDKRFNADHVKVVTENGVVYLMGLVSRAEANAATEVASTTGGVQRVMRLFEYLD